MAYCAYCGKQLPEGTLCDCPDAQTIMLAVQQAMQAQKNTAPAPEPKKKKHIWIPVTAAVLATTLIAGVGGYFIYPMLNRDSSKKSDRSARSTSTYSESNDRSTGGKSVLSAAQGSDSYTADDSRQLLTNEPGEQQSTQSAPSYTMQQGDFTPSNEYEERIVEYYSALYSPSGGEDFYSFIYPAELTDALRSDGSLDEMIREFNDDNSSFSSSGSTGQIGSVISEEKLSADELDTVAEHFDDVCSNFGVKARDIDVSEGAEIEVEYIYSYGNGSVTTRNASLCVVYLDGDGWKVIPMSVK